MWVHSGLGGLFLAAFLAATPVRFQPEIIFVAAQAGAIAPVWVLILVASVGNTLGSVVTYGIGRGVLRWQDRAWFPLTEGQMGRAEGWFGRWGLWALLLSWAPFGDAIVLVSGVMRTPLSVFVALVALAKTGRYVVLAGLADLFL